MYLYALLMLALIYDLHLRCEDSETFPNLCVVRHYFGLLRMLLGIVLSYKYNFNSVPLSLIRLANLLEAK